MKTFSLLFCFSVLDKSTLQEYRKQVERGRQFIEFNRMQISSVRQLLRIYKNPKLNLRQEPDVCFVGELGADMGGPKKEFFSQALQSLCRVDPLYNLQLFGGVEDHLVPLYGVDAISEGLFEIAGKIVAHSVLHGCDGFVGLSPAVVKYIETGSVTKAEQLVTTEDLPDIELRNIIESKVRLF